MGVGHISVSASFVSFVFALGSISMGACGLEKLCWHMKPTVPFWRHPGTSLHPMLDINHNRIATRSQASLSIAP